MKVRRCVALVFVLIISVLAPTTTASAAVGDNEGFMQIRDNGQLWYYAWTGNGFVGHLADGGGWGQTKLIATVSTDRFVEIKGDALRTWSLFPTATGYGVALVDESSPPGWSTMRAITGVGNVAGDGGKEIIGITANGDLMLYLSRGGSYVWERRLATGYENVRLIAGLSGTASLANGHWVIVNNLGDLYECTLSNPTCSRRMSGWQDARLLGPGGTVPGTTNGDAFTEVKQNGQLVHWYWWGGNYTTGFTDTNWFNARLIG